MAKSRLSDLEARAIVISIMAVGNVSEMILASVKGIGKKRARELIALEPNKAENKQFARIIAETQRKRSKKAWTGS